ncbi:uncharacterized protein, partial [Aristolochia californica]|uniref:uncharacterized protein n=1 Tax=Aristolochia californica TaxID=171875 RepID=UPI0035DE1E76
PATDFTRKSVFPENVTKSTTILRKTSAIFNDTDPTKTGSRNVTESKPRSRGVSPLVRSRIPSTLRGFSNETPPNLKTAVSDRSTSASRGRPANPVPPDTKPEGVNPRRQSCSPSVMRGRKPDPKSDTQKEKAQGSNGGIIFGSRMVEKVMNARKSVAGEEKDPKPRYRVSSDVSGFGRMLSKSSLDMALKHMIQEQCLRDSCTVILTAVELAPEPPDCKV